MLPPNDVVKLTKVEGASVQVAVPWMFWLSASVVDCCARPRKPSRPSYCTKPGETTFPDCSKRSKPPRSASTRRLVPRSSGVKLTVALPIWRKTSSVSVRLS